jgi:oxygen-dependent protoporphyrinogen oxidase
VGPREKMKNVVIIGGGIAGLAAAYELHRRGVPFVLLERGARLGGVVFSEQVDGFTIDGGRLYPLPAASVLGIPTRWGPFIRTGLFSWPGKLRMGAELFIPRRKNDEDESIGSFMTRRFGREAAVFLAEPLLAGIHAGDVDRLSVCALFPRFREVERQHGSLLKGFRREHESQNRARSHDGAFRSLPGGLSELIEALAAALPAPSIRLETSADRVVSASAGGTVPVAGGRLDPSAAPSARYRVETAAGDAISAAAIVLATPAFVTARLIRALDAHLADLCDQVPYASTATVALAFTRAAVAHPLNGSGFVVPRVEGTGILAASWLSSKWPHRAAADYVLMRTFVGGARDPDAFDRTDEDLVATSLNALRPLLRITGPPLLTRVYRWERASAQHEVGHLDRQDRIDQALATHAGLFVTGSGFRGIGIPDCIADGRATAARVTEYLRGKLRNEELRNGGTKEPATPVPSS